MGTAEVTSPHQHEEELIQGVVQHTKKIDPTFAIDKATPATTDQSQDDSDLVANVEHALKVGRSSVTGESVWARMGKAIRGVNILNKRKAQKAKMSPDDFKSDLDVGE